MTKRAFDLSEVFAKLDRASEHMQTVSSQTESFLKHDPAPFGFRTKETSGSGKSVE
jgi:hypothetical protein